MPMSKIKNLETIQSSFAHYKSGVEDPVLKKDYVQIIYLFMKYLTMRILDGHFIHLPLLGTIAVRGKKDKPRINEEGRIKGLSIDYNATKLARKINPEAPVIYHFNEHTNGYSYIIFWCKVRMYGENKDLYSFSPTRFMKRELARRIKAREIEYEVDLK